METCPCVALSSIVTHRDPATQRYQVPKGAPPHPKSRKGVWTFSGGGDTRGELHTSPGGPEQSQGRPQQPWTLLVTPPSRSCVFHTLPHTVATTIRFPFYFLSFDPLSTPRIQPQNALEPISRNTHSAKVLILQGELKDQLPDSAPDSLTCKNHSTLLLPPASRLLLSITLPSFHFLLSLTVYRSSAQ